MAIPTRPIGGPNPEHKNEPEVSDDWDDFSAINNEPVVSERDQIPDDYDPRADDVFFDFEDQGEDVEDKPATGSESPREEDSDEIGWGEFRPEEEFDKGEDDEEEFDPELEAEFARMFSGPEGQGLSEEEISERISSALNPQDDEASGEENQKLPADEDFIDEFAEFKKEIQEEIEEEEGEPEATAPPTHKKSSPKTKTKKPSLYKRFSTKLFTALSKIPLLGRLFAPLVPFAHIVLAIMLALILIIIPLSIYNSAVAAIPKSFAIELPDNGSAIIKNVSYDAKTETVKAEVTNTGDIVVELTPIYTMWKYNPGTSLNSFTENGVCKGVAVLVEIDETVEVEFVCALADGAGLVNRASAELEF